MGDDEEESESLEAIDLASEVQTPISTSRPRRVGSRSGVTVGAVVIALVAALLVTVAVVTHSNGKPAVHKQTATSSSHPAATTACTLGDLHRAGSVPTPPPVVLARTRIFNYLGARLDPPPVGVRPLVSASRAWQMSRIKSPEGSYQLVLASYTSAYPSRNRPPEFSHVVAWVVIGRNVPLPTLPALEPPTIPGEQPTIGQPSAPCAFDFALDAFDAHTGKELVPTRVVCRVSLGHDTTSVVVKLAKAATASATTGGYTVRFSIVRVPGPDGFGEMRANVTGLGQNDLVEGGFSSSQPGLGGNFPTPKGLFAYGCGG